jgi:hypothetical protein
MEKSFEWIKQAINSSVSDFHLDCCKILISLFAKKYESDQLISKYYGDLIDEVINKETFLCVEV